MEENKQYSTVIGYVFNEDGMYDYKYYFEGTPENIANFIMAYPYKDITITDGADNLILTTRMGFVDTCTDQRFLANELLPALLPRQLGDIEVEPLEFIQDEEYGNNFVHTMEQSL